MFKKKILPIGLDISDLSVKAVQLARTKDKYEIVGIGKYNLKPGIVDDGEIVNEEEFVKSIRQIIKKPVRGSFSGSDVVACLPDIKTFIKLLEVDHGPNKPALQIASEMEKNFPFSKKEVYYDWQIIEKGHSSDQVLIAAAPKIIVDNYSQVLKNADLEINAFEVESMAISRCLLEEECSHSPKKEGDNYCLIDIGAKRTSLTIYSTNTIVLSVSLPISGNETTGLISSALEINHNEAEKAKIVCGLDEGKANGIVAKILSEMIESLGQKIEQTINYYYKHYPNHGEVNKIILCGGGSNIRLLDQTLEKMTSISTTQGNTLRTIQISSEELTKIFSEKHKIDTRKIKDMEDDFLIKKQNSAASFTTAIGLALRNCLIQE